MNFFTSFFVLLDLFITFVSNNKYMDYKKLITTLLLASSLNLTRYKFKTEYDVMNYLFAVIGNGFDWVDGQLTSSSLDEFPNELYELVDHFTSSDEYNQVLGTIGVTNMNPTLFGDIGLKFDVYPMSKFSLIAHIPDNISPDYYSALRQFIKTTSNLDNLPQTDRKILGEVEVKLNYLKQKNNIDYGNS